MLDPRPNRRWGRWILITAILATGLCGCFDVRDKGDFTDRWFNPPKKVLAEYTGLNNHTVAVLVGADPKIMAYRPLAPFEVCESLSNGIADHVGSSVVDAKVVDRFQRRNPLWHTMDYSKIAKALNVQRLVLVELSEYRLNEPGSPDLWRGVITASIGVVEADGPKPDDMAYFADSESVAYPKTSKQPMIKGDANTMHLAVMDIFSRRVTRLFYDHEVKSP